MKLIVKCLACCFIAVIAGCDLFVSAAVRLERANRAEAQGNYGLAAVELHNLLQSQPENLTARVKLVEVLLLQSNLSGAEAEAKPLRKLAGAPGLPADAADIVARLLLAKRDFSGLLAAIQSGELKLADPNLALREAQAMIGLKQVQPATLKLQQVVQQQPDNIEAHVWHAQALASAGENELALQELDAAVVKSPTNATAWLAKGLLQTRQGVTTGAIQSLTKAMEHAAGQLTLLEEMGALSLLIELELPLGKVAEATQQQQRLAAIAPSFPVTQLMAAHVAFAKADYGAVISVLQKLLATDPNLSPARILLGKALAAQGNLRQAEVELERLLATAGDNIAARKILAEVELRLGQNVRAVEVLTPILDTALSDAQVAALITQAQLAVAKLPADIERLLALQKRAPENESLRLVVVGTLLRAEQITPAIALLRDTQKAPFDVRRVPLLLKAIAADKGLAAARSEADRIGAANANDARYLATLGLFFAGREDYATARVWLVRSLVKLRATKAGAQGELEAKDAKDDANAITEQDAVAQRVGELGLLKTIGLVDVRLGDKTAALAGIQAYRQAHPTDLSAVLIEGDILMELRDFRAADAAYESALAKAPSPQLVMGVYRARQLAGLALPTQPLEQWLRAHEDDIAIRMALAEAYQSSGDANKAVREYERLVAAQPTNVAALNNLAWLYQTMGDKRAEITARQAYDRAQKSPEVADTYGWILLQNGHIVEGAEILAAALAGAPHHPDIQFHQAVALIKTGASAEARKRLTDLLAQSPKFSTRADAEKALAELNSK